MKNQLSFALLRKANALRLPLFKNRLGEPAHSTPNGSDWSPAEWFCALVGEIGEYATERIEFEEGRLTLPDYTAVANKELADIATYLDLNALRALDLVPFCARSNGEHSPAQQLMTVMAVLGLYAEARKKYRRGDTQKEDFINSMRLLLQQTMREIAELIDIEEEALSDGREHATDKVTLAHAEGVDLGAATTAKFNEVSERVGVDVIINESGRCVVCDGKVVIPEDL